MSNNHTKIISKKILLTHSDHILIVFYFELICVAVRLFSPLLWRIRSLIVDGSGILDNLGPNQKKMNLIQYPLEIILRTEEGRWKISETGLA